MKYMGSKARIAKHILPIMLKAAEERGITHWVEPFVGGANMIDKVPSHFTRTGIDINHYLIEMWTALQGGWVPPSLVTEDEYNHIKKNKEQYHPAFVGFVGIGCSYAGKWFGGYARGNDANGNARNYTTESVNNILAQVPSITGVNFLTSDYTYVSALSSSAVIYCDPPYEGTTKYKDDFNHNAFWQWCRDMSGKGHLIFVSEYNAPSDFECIWEKQVNNTLVKNTGSKQGTEKLFIFKP